MTGLLCPMHCMSKVSSRLGQGIVHLRWSYAKLEVYTTQVSNKVCQQSKQPLVSFMVYCIMVCLYGLECTCQGTAKKLTCTLHYKKDKIGRAKPWEWGYFSTTSTVNKIFRNNCPNQLFTSFNKNIYHERRKPGRLQFFNNSNTNIGINCLKNRLTDIFNVMDFDHYPSISDNGLRTNLKKLLF